VRARALFPSCASALTEGTGGGSWGASVGYHGLSRGTSHGHGHGAGPIMHAIDSAEHKANLALAQVCPSWPRFIAACAVLEASLTDIADWLPSRRLACFTGREMAGLVRALFEESPKRQAILQSVDEMSS